MFERAKRWIVINGMIAIAVYVLWTILVYMLPVVLILQRILLFLLSWLGSRAADRLEKSINKPNH